MIALRSDFEDKVRHINLYFDMLRDIVENNATIQYLGTTKIIDHELSKVLKANVFLLLYNLVESTVRKSVEHIHITINSETGKFSEYNEAIQKIWIEFNYANFKEKDSEVILKAIQNIVNDSITVEYEKYVKKRKSNDVPGNVDALKVRDLAKKYSFQTNTRVAGGRLVVIKNKRNNLAHGNISFAECGKDYTYSDLLKLKKEAILFLREFMDKVDFYTTNKKYRV